MADPNRGTSRRAGNALFVLMALALIAVIGLGVYYFVAEREPVYSPLEGRTEAKTGSEAETLDTLAQRLVLATFAHDPTARTIEGSVMNNTSTPFVNVHVGFTLLDEDSMRVGSVEETTSEIEPGDTWRFRIPVVSEASYSRVIPTELDGEPKKQLGEPAEPMQTENPPR